MYYVTGATYLKRPIFRGASRLEYLTDTFLDACEKHQWQLQAWAVFPNHYHFVASSPSESTTLTPLSKEFHSRSAFKPIAGTILPAAKFGSSSGKPR